MGKNLPMSPSVFFVLGIGMPALLFYVYDARFAHPALPLHWMMIVLLAIPVAYTSRTQRYLELSTYLFAYVFFGLASTAQLIAGRFPLGGSYEVSEVLWADFLILVGLLSFGVGAGANRRRDVRWASKPITVHRVRIAAIVSVALFVLAISYFGVETSVFFLARNEAMEEMMKATGSGESLVNLQIATSLIRLPIMVASAISLAFTIFHDRLRWLTAGLIIANVVINNPISTPRFVFGTWAIAYFLIVGLRYFPRRTGTIFAVSLPVLFTVAFPILDLFRFSLENTSVEESVFVTFATKGDFDSFQLIMDAGRYVSNQGVEAGRQLAGSVGFFVPRSLWSSKPEATGVLLGVWGQRQNLNLAAPLWIELYIDAWWFGLALGMGGFGYVCRRLQRSLSVPTINVAAALVPLLCGAAMIALRGSLMIAMSFLLPIILFSIFLSAKTLRVSAAHRGTERPSHGAEQFIASSQSGRS